MRIANVVALVLVATTVIVAQALDPRRSADHRCREQNLAHFRSGGHEVRPEIVGDDDPCDGFGGAGARTPVHRVWVYVNANIPAEVDLDAIDRAIGLLPPDLQRFFERIDVAVVVPGQIRRWYGTDDEWALSWNGDTLFVSATLAARPGALDALLREFYVGPRKGGP